MTPEATARLAALPESLRAWARQDPRVRQHLTAHVVDGLPLGHALARLGSALGDGGDWIVHDHQAEGITTERFWPWCARELPDGLRCRELVRVLVHRATGGAVEACHDCAPAYGGRVLRELVRR